MDEGRRFLRYVLPGTVALLEFYAFAWLLAPWWAQRVNQQVLSSKDTGLGLAVAGIVASGALGYTLSVVHHAIYWCGILPRWFDPGPNFVDTLKRLGRRVTLRDASNDSELPQGDRFLRGREFAWATVSATWHARLGSSDAIKAANPRVDSLGDLAHSMGTGRVGVAVATVGATLVGVFEGQLACEASSLGRALVMAVLAISLYFVHHTSYGRVSRLLVQIVEQVLHSSLERERGGSPPSGNSKEPTDSAATHSKPVIYVVVPAPSPE